MTRENKDRIYHSHSHLIRMGQIEFCKFEKGLKIRKYNSFHVSMLDSLDKYQQYSNIILQYQYEYIYIS